MACGQRHGGVFTMRIARCAAVGLARTGCCSCGRPSQPPPPATTESQPSEAGVPDAVDDAEPDDNVPPAAVRTAPMLRALLPSNTTGCAPGARCIRVTANGRPQATGSSIAQCRGEFADFIVPRNTIPTGYNGPW